MTEPSRSQARSAPTTPPLLPPAAFRLDGRTALVTGASKNIGAAISTALAAAGADLVMVARDSARLERKSEEIRAGYPERRITTFAADVSDPEMVDRLVAHCLEGHLDVDVIVNNAHASGKTEGTPILELADPTFDTVFRTNVFGPYRLIRGLIKPLMNSGRTGSVINLLSGAGFLPVRGFAPYGASKAALWQLTRYLASECAPLVRVNAICPGLTTEDGAPRTVAAERMLADGSVPLGRVGHPSEIAGAAVYLASPAASYTTGTVVFCNGGRPW